MTNNPDEHYKALGKVAMAASALEEAMVVYNVHLTELLDSKRRYLKDKKGKRITSKRIEGRLRWQSWAHNAASLKELIKQGGPNLRRRAFLRLTRLELLDCFLKNFDGVERLDLFGSEFSSAELNPRQEVLALCSAVPMHV